MLIRLDDDSSKFILYPSWIDVMFSAVTIHDTSAKVRKSFKSDRFGCSDYFDACAVRLNPLPNL
ncbi:hypothetical protein [Coleofasciculus sp. H7-2]|uniref:hypothetical protein n=1 Tax=Coleofasciculus sp. H7-2 TaxID=3351545 RepID=UPI00366F6466